MDDMLFLPQVQLLVTDGGTPSRSDTSVLTVTVRRNLNSPVFNPATYTVEINEDQQLGVSIGQVFATDADSPKVGNSSSHLSSVVSALDKEG